MSSLPPQSVHLVPPHSQPGGGTGGEIFQTEKISRTPHLTSAATLESRSRSLHQSGALQAWKATYPYGGVREKTHGFGTFEKVLRSG